MVSQVIDRSEYQATLMKQIEEVVSTMSAASAKELRAVMTTCVERSADPKILRHDRELYDKLGKMIRHAIK